MSGLAAGSGAIASLPVLVLVAGAASAMLGLLARAYRVRVGIGSLLLAAAIPFLLLAPWIDGDPALLPTGPLENQLPGLSRPATVDPHGLLNDTVFQLLPWELEVRRSFAAGSLPLWSDRIGGGSSPWANPQAGALSPVALVARLFPLDRFLLVSLLVKMIVAFHGAAVLALLLGARRGTALVAGALVTLSGAIQPWGLFPLSTAMAWVPWVAAGMVILTRRPDRSALAATVGSVAALLASGHPETALFGSLASVLLAILVRRRGRSPFRALVRVGAAVLFGAGLTAPLLIPFTAVASSSQRSLERQESPAPSNASGRARFPSSLFPPEWGRSPVGLSGPRAFGEPYDPGRHGIPWPDALSPYAGVIGLGGALAALASRRRAAGRVAALVAAACLLLAMQPIPVMRALWVFPWIRVPAWERFLPLVALFLGVAGALGSERLRDRREGLGPWAAFLAAAILALFRSPDRASFLAWGAAGAASLLGRLASGPLARWPIVRSTSPAALLLLLAVTLGDLGPWARLQLPEGRTQSFYPPSAFLSLARLETERGGDPPGRFLATDFSLYPGLGAVYGLEDPRPHDPMAPKELLDLLEVALGYHPGTKSYFDGVDRLDHPLLDLLGAQVVASTGEKPPAPRFIRIPYEGPGEMTLWRNPTALPRFFLPSEIERVASGETKLALERLDTPWTVVVDGATGASLSASPDGRGIVPRLRRTRAGTFEVEIPTSPEPGDRLLASSVPASPGWEARGPDGPLRTLRVDGALVGVAVPGSVAKVTLTYLPPGWKLGLAVSVFSGLTLLMLLGGWLPPGLAVVSEPGRRTTR